MFIFLGLNENVWLMAGTIFLLMLPLAMTGALFTSLIQRKTPLHMLGRIFVVFGQLSALSAPLSFLVTGPIVDGWLEPSMLEGRWTWLISVFGQGPGSGIALLFVVCGILLLGGIFITCCSTGVRNLETSMPDYMEENP